MTTPNDPFSLVLAKLWEILEGHPGLAALVKPANRIKISDGKPGSNPFKDSISTADLPELTAEPSSFSGDITATSSSIKLVQSYDIRLATGDLRTPTMFAAKWEILKALAATNGTLGLAFVKGITLGDGRDGLDDQEANRGEPGWSTVCRLDVLMFFNRSTMATS